MEQDQKNKGRRRRGLKRCLRSLAKTSQTARKTWTRCSSTSTRSSRPARPKRRPTSNARRGGRRRWRACSKRLVFSPARVSGFCRRNSLKAEPAEFFIYPGDLFSHARVQLGTRLAQQYGTCSFRTDRQD